MSDQFSAKKGEGANHFTEVIGSYFQNGKKGKVESFADLLDTYTSSMNEDIQIGDKVRGEIISVGMDSVFVNTGTKIDGAVEKKEMLDENGEFNYNIGDVLELYVISASETEIRLSKALSGIGGLNLLRDSYEKGIPVEGKVTEQCKGGFRVEMLQRKAFCPISQMDLKYVENPEPYVGESHLFLIERFEESGKNIVVSRRKLLEREQRAAQKVFMREVAAGTVLEGTVSSVMPYGAFVELFPGIKGMVHVSEMSWSRVENPETVLSVGETVRVKVTGMESGKKPNDLRIGLSIRQTVENPWDSGEVIFQKGDRLRGKVTRCMDFGAFVEISPGIEGLVHISQMSYKKRVMKSEDMVQPGDMVDVVVKGTDMGKRRISLSMKDAEGDPWIDVPGKYSVGQAVDGTVEKKEKFGLFITLEPGITGLMPKSKISKSTNPSAIEKLRAGDPITVLIEEIRPTDRKITLGPGDAKEEDNWQKYTEEAKFSLGSLGEKLQQAIDAKIR